MSELFTEAELAFIDKLKFARYATSTPDGHPHVVPGRAHIENGKIVIPGWEMKRSYKFRAVKRNKWVAVVWDERSPEGGAMGVEVRGEGVSIEDLNHPDESYQYRIEVTPTKVFSWGINESLDESFQVKMGYPSRHSRVRTEGTPSVLDRAATA